MDTNPEPASEPGSERIDIPDAPPATGLPQRAAAAEELADRVHFLLDAEAFQRFVGRLDAPPAPSAALRRLMRTEAP